jgi:hypothetical protein
MLSGRGIAWLGQWRSQATIQAICADNREDVRWKGGAGERAQFVPGAVLVGGVFVVGLLTGGGSETARQPQPRKVGAGVPPWE